MVPDMQLLHPHGYTNVESANWIANWVATAGPIAASHLPQLLNSNKEFIV